MGPSGGTRPKGIHSKHLTELERFRVRTLYFDAGMSKPRIKQVTGYSTSQIRTAVSAKSAAVAPRSGRPKRGPNGQLIPTKQTDNAGPSSQNTAEDASATASSKDTNQTPATTASNNGTSQTAVPTTSPSPSTPLESSPEASERQPSPMVIDTPPPSVPSAVPFASP